MPATGRARASRWTDLRPAPGRGGVPGRAGGSRIMNTAANTVMSSSRQSMRSAVNYEQQRHVVVRRTPPAKRALDIVLAGSGLLLSAPIWAALAGLIKLEDGGPIFFGQDRVGQGGLIFRALKFRSMVVNADSVAGPRQASEHDPRVTRIGRIMRATAMDELPQLWNIFRGDMSLVGPRALVPGEI